MRSDNGGLAYGTNGNPQIHMEQMTYAAKVTENEAKVKELTSQSMIDESLIAELERNGVKFTRKDMLSSRATKLGR